jgi:hypothetical protein
MKLSKLDLVLTVDSCRAALQRDSRMGDHSGCRPVRIPGYWIDGEGLDIPIDAPLQSGEQNLCRLHGGDTSLSLLIRQSLPRRYPGPSWRPARSSGGCSRSSNGFPALRCIPHKMLSPQRCSMHGGGLSRSKSCTHISPLSHRTPERRGHPLPAPPTGLILLSPWTDMGVAREPPELAMLSFASSDTFGWGLHGQKAYPKLAPGQTGKQCCGHKSLYPPSSVSEVRFANFPRTFINAGGAKILVDQIRTGNGWQRIWARGMALAE